MDVFCPSFSLHRGNHHWGRRLLHVLRWSVTLLIIWIFLIFLLPDDINKCAAPKKITKATQTICFLGCDLSIQYMFVKFSSSCYVVKLHHSTLLYVYVMLLYYHSVGSRPTNSLQVNLYSKCPMKHYAHTCDSYLDGRRGDQLNDPLDERSLNGQRVATLRTDE